MEWQGQPSCRGAGPLLGDTTEVVGEIAPASDSEPWISTFRSRSCVGCSLCALGQGRFDNDNNNDNDNDYIGVDTDASLAVLSTLHVSTYVIFPTPL